MQKQSMVIVTLIVCVLLAGCASISMKKFLPNSINQNPKLYSLNVEYNKTNSKLSGLSDPKVITDLFQYQYHQEDAPSYGKLVYTVKEKRSYVAPLLISLPLGVVSAVTLCSLNLLGLPFAYLTTHTDVDLAIYDSRGDLVKTYAAGSRGNAYMAMYYGYSNPAPTATAVAVKNTINKLYKQQLRDLNLINSALRSTADSDAKAWAAASRENTIPAYQVYTDEFKYGVYYFKAMSRADSIGWANACQLNTIASYSKYKANFSQGRHVTVADNRIGSLHQAVTDSVQWASINTDNSLIPVYKYIEGFNQKKYKTTYLDEAWSLFDASLKEQLNSEVCNDSCVKNVLPLDFHYFKSLDIQKLMNSIPAAKYNMLITVNDGRGLLRCDYSSGVSKTDRVNQNTLFSLHFNRNNYLNYQMIVPKVIKYSTHTFWVSFSETSDEVRLTFEDVSSTEQPNHQIVLRNEDPKKPNALTTLEEYDAGALSKVYIFRKGTWYMLTAGNV